jgi:4-amino-4-deoxy-L-arabinose transferase-like glycosyltransferase
MPTGAVVALSIAFLLQGAFILERPGLHAGELQSYIGQFTAEFSRSLEPLRIASLLVGAVTLAIGVLIAKRLGGTVAAVITGIVFATDPAFLFTTRMDAGGFVLPRLLVSAGILLLASFWRSASKWTLAAGFFCLGLAAATRPETLGLLLAIAMGGVAAFASDIRAAFGMRTAIPALASFCAPLAILAASRPHFDPPVLSPFNVVDGSAWFAVFVRHEFGTWGVGPKPGLERFVAGFSRAFAQPRHDMLAAVLVISLVGGALLLRRRAIRFTWVTLVAGGVWYLLFAPEALPLVWPWPDILVGLVLSESARRWAFGPPLAGALVVVLVISNLAVTATYYSRLLIYGATRDWSEAIYSLARDLDIRDARSVRILNPEIEAPLRYLSGPRLVISENNSGPDTILVAFTDVDGQDQVHRVVAERGRRPHRVRLIQDWQGRAVYQLVRLE